MGYPNIGNVKTIVLPIPANEMSCEQYKETYGIDLKDLIFIDDRFIRFKGGRNISILLDPSDFLGAIDYTENKWGLSPVIKLSTTSYTAGESDAQITMEENQILVALQLRISRNTEFSFENLTISGAEI